ncbi:MAG: hypothetical protein MJH11_20350 [Lentisphaeria bacterium]|nr:hypothetical protein [Lentisphaeria bacterium]NQY67298.1 hypothetical protein [Flavobacteriales bacterium]
MSDPKKIKKFGEKVKVGQESKIKSKGDSFFRKSRKFGAKMHAGEYKDRTKGFYSTAKPGSIIKGQKSGHIGPRPKRWGVPKVNLTKIYPGKPGIFSSVFGKAKGLAGGTISKSLGVLKFLTIGMIGAHVVQGEYLEAGEVAGRDFVTIGKAGGVAAGIVEENRIISVRENAEKVERGRSVNKATDYYKRFE